MRLIIVPNALVSLMSLIACLRYNMGEERTKHWTWLSGHLEETKSYTARCPQKMMKNINILSPNLLQQKKGIKSKDGQFLYSVEGGRIKDCKKMRREWERLSEWALAVGQITGVCGIHTDFMKLISKQQLEEKARQRHMRTAAEREWEMQST